MRLRTVRSVSTEAGFGRGFGFVQTEGFSSDFTGRNFIQHCNDVAITMPDYAVGLDLAFDGDVHALAVTSALHIYASSFGAYAGFDHDGSLGLPRFKISACDNQVG